MADDVEEQMSLDVSAYESVAYETYSQEAQRERVRQRLLKAGVDEKDLIAAETRAREKADEDEAAVQTARRYFDAASSR